MDIYGNNRCNVIYSSANFADEKLFTVVGTFIYRADSRFAPSQWEAVLLCNNVSHWLSTNLESALIHTWVQRLILPALACFSWNQGMGLYTLRLKQNGLHIADDTFKCISWMKMLEFQLKFHWSLFLRVQFIIFHHWFRKWLGSNQVTRHYLDQWWLYYWHIYAPIGLNELSIHTFAVICNKLLIKSLASVVVWLNLHWSQSIIIFHKFMFLCNYSFYPCP